MCVYVCYAFTCVVMRVYVFYELLRVCMSLYACPEFYVCLCIL